MVPTTRILMVLLLGLCIAGCDSSPAPQSVPLQPLPASIPYRPNNAHPESAKQVVFVAPTAETSAGTWAHS